MAVGALVRKQGATAAALFVIEAGGPAGSGRGRRGGDSLLAQGRGRAAAAVEPKRRGISTSTTASREARKAAPPRVAAGNEEGGAVVREGVGVGATTAPRVQDGGGRRGATPSRREEGPSA